MSKQLMWGWFWAIFGAIIIQGFSKVFIAYSGQGLNANPMVFTCVAFNISALVLLLFGGKGALSRETMRSIQTWGYGIVMVALYIIAFLLFREVGATEGGFLQRSSVFFSVLAAWLFFNRGMSKLKLSGVVLISLSVIAMISDTPEDKLVTVISLVTLWGFFHAIRVFIAELHQPHSKAAKLQDPKARARVVGFVMFVVSLLFTFITLSLAGLNSMSANTLPDIIPSFSDFLDRKVILMAMVVGVLFTAPLRLIEFVSSNTIKSENFLAISCLASMATYFWEWLSSPLTGLSLREFTTLDITSGILITIGGLIMVLASVKSKGKENNFKEYLKVSSQDLETIEETREIIANTLEHFDSSLKRTAEALKIPQFVINAILEDKEKVLAFHDDLLRKVAKRYRKNVATADSLTGLLNKAGFKTALKAASFESDTMSLYFIDLNKFKPVNDTYGHEAGDYVLTVVAERLRELFPTKSLITRLGGDEYCILLLGVTKEQAEEKINSISKSLEKEIIYQEDKISISGSIGLANYPTDTNHPEELIKLADKQMYIEKEGR